jgi:hypothetical protein
MSIEIKQPRRRLFHKCKFDVFMNEQPTASGGKLITKRCSKCGRVHTDVILPMTNYERIKNMSIEELAEFMHGQLCGKCTYNEGYDEDGKIQCSLSRKFDDDCINGTVEWLKQNV